MFKEYINEETVAALALKYKNTKSNVVKSRIFKKLMIYISKGLNMLLIKKYDEELYLKLKKRFC